MNATVLNSPVEAPRSAVAHWDDLLRAYAAVLDDQRAMLLAVDPDRPLTGDALAVPSFVPPADAPPLPASMRGWAQALLDETEGLAGLAHEILERHPRPERRTPPAAGGASLDQKL